MTLNTDHLKRCISTLESPLAFYQKTEPRGITAPCPQFEHTRWTCRRNTCNRCGRCCAPTSRTPKYGPMAAVSAAVAMKPATSISCCGTRKT